MSDDTELTLRDRFALEALRGIVDDCGLSDIEMAERCYEAADAMLIVRQRETPSTRADLSQALADEREYLAAVSRLVDSHYSGGNPDNIKRGLWTYDTDIGNLVRSVRKP